MAIGKTGMCVTLVTLVETFITIYFFHYSLFTLFFPHQLFWENFWGKKNDWHFRIAGRWREQSRCAVWIDLKKSWIATTAYSGVVAFLLHVTLTFFRFESKAHLVPGRNVFYSLHTHFYIFAQISSIAGMTFLLMQLIAIILK